MKVTSINLVEQLVNHHAQEFRKLSQYIYDHPELGHEEYLSSKAHIDLLQSHGFEVESAYLGIPTAFKAKYDSKKPGPSIAFLSEYDALPGIGHGCGHNLLGATDTGAGIVLSKFIDEVGGCVYVFGTPAEETNGDKVDMARQGSFDPVDVVFCTHPGAKFYKSSSSMAMDAYEFKFYGQAAHAASAPHQGRNALDACINFYHNISTMRQQIKPTDRVHGVIKEGGLAANIIPDYTRAEFYIRSTNMEDLKNLRERVFECARAAAVASACQVEWGKYEKSYKNLITNQRLSQLFNEKMAELGVEMVDNPDASGSMDMGDVSQVVPAINPYFAITNEKEIYPHTEAFREATLTNFAHNSMKKTIAGLVATSLAIIQHPEILNEINLEFKKQVKGV